MREHGRTLPAILWAILSAIAQRATVEASATAGPHSALRIGTVLHSAFYVPRCLIPSPRSVIPSGAEGSRLESVVAKSAIRNFTRRSPPRRVEEGRNPRKALQDHSSERQSKISGPRPPGAGASGKSRIKSPAEPGVVL